MLFRELKPEILSAIEEIRLENKNRKPIRPKVSIPKGRGYSKSETLKHFSNLNGASIQKYCKDNNLNIKHFCEAQFQYNKEDWFSYIEENGLQKIEKCSYCSTKYVKFNNNHKYCNPKCATLYKADKYYFDGKRSNTMGLQEGMCQLCGGEPRTGLSSHHILGKENDEGNELLIALCRGCHDLVTKLATRKFVDDTEAWERLIGLVMMRRFGPEIAEDLKNGI